MVLRLALWVCLLLPVSRVGAAPPHPKSGPRLALRRLRAPRAQRPWTLVTLRARPAPARLGPCVGPVCVESVWPAALERFLDDPDLLLADLPGRLRLRLDVAGPLVGAPQARERTSLTGRGVLVAVLDTGLDWTHSDFRNPDGRTRVAWLLDQSLPPAGLHPELEALGAGAVFSAEDLQQVLDTGQGVARNAGLDTIGHGTHVAGIAVGGDPIFTGVAPGAGLVVVKAIGADGFFSDDRILAGLAFARQVAVLAGRPLVVNLSLGTQLGAHDGSDPIELALEALATSPDPPCAVTVAAGNEGQLALHARGALRAGGPALALEVVLANTEPPGVTQPARVVIDTWLDGQGRVDLTVVSPTGWRSDPVGQRSQVFSETTWSPDGQVGLTVSPQPSPIDGLIRITIELSGQAGQALKPGTWILELRGQADRIDAWIGEWDLAGGPVPRFANRVDPDELVGPPATARGVVAVGASTGRTRWPSADGGEHGLSGQTTGALADFSVRGPTRDGRLKPELVAPGQAIASSLSADADPRSPSSIFYSGGSLRMVLPDGRHAVASGTSMAAPFAAGLAALAWEQRPWSSGRDWLDRLQVRCAADATTGTALFDPAWGFGKLAALEALDPDPWDPSSELDVAPSLCGLARDWMPSDPNQLTLVTAIPRAPDGRPLGPGLPVTITAAPDGVFAGPVIDHGNGLYTRSLTGRGPRGQRLRAQCAMAERVFTAEPEIRLAASADEANRGGVTGGAGGCSQSGQPDRLPGWALLWVWLGMVRRWSQGLV